MSKKISTFKNTRISSILCNVKLWYSEKAEINWPIFHFLLDATMYVPYVKNERRMNQIFGAFSEYPNFISEKKYKCVKFAVCLFCSQFKVAKNASYDCLIIFTVFKRLFSVKLVCCYFLLVYFVSSVDQSWGTETDFLPSNV